MNGPATTDFVQQADRSVIEASVRHVRAKGHHGVLAIRAVPRWDGELFAVDGGSVRIHPCATVLAVRDALTHRLDPDTQLVILTDLSAEELGDGICDHLVTGRPLQPDPWLSLRERFAAGTQEASLLPTNEAARAALAQLGGERPAPAPGGVLTREHLMRTLTAAQFGFVDADPSAVDLLVFSADPAVDRRFRQWRAGTHPDLVADVFDYFAVTLGPPAAGIIAAWRHQGLADLLPLGLVVGLLVTGAGGSPAPEERGIIAIRTRLEERIVGTPLTDEALAGWARTAALAAGRIALSRGPEAALFPGVQRRADVLTSELGAADLAEGSDYIPMALDRRLARFAEAAEAAVAGWADGSGPTGSSMDPLESAWNRVHDHVTSGAAADGAWPSDVLLAQAVLRLLRYAASTATNGAGPARPDLAGIVAGYRDGGSWVDAAVNDAFVGSDHPRLAEVSRRVLDRIRTVRSNQDRAAAQLIAAAGTWRPDRSTPTAPLMIEDVLDRVLLPLTAPIPPQAGTNDVDSGPSPVLLVVADGMSAAAAHDVLSDISTRQAAIWQEVDLTIAPGSTQPLGRTRAALTVLPSVTEHSRCSLFSGRIASGVAATEVRNFNAWLASHSLGSNAKVLFHKGDIEAASAGHALPVAVRQAVDDIVHRPVIGCVLNAIDDALNRSDPIGAQWSIATLRPLEALLQAAARVGRIVVLASDHGHVPERRERPTRQRGQAISARWRPADASFAVDDDELLVEGDRVAVDGNRAVLAVAEQLRYGSMKAGYHGGAALAEVVAPIAILVPGEIPAHLPLMPSGGGVPAWWVGVELVSAAAGVAAAGVAGRAAESTRPRPRRGAASDQEPGLFSTDSPAVVAQAAPLADRVDRLVVSEQFEDNRRVFAFSLSAQQIATLLRALIATGGRLSRPRAAAVLNVADRRLPGTLAVIGQVLNIDGIAVLTQDNSEVTLHEGLLFEQFGIPG